MWVLAFSSVMSRMDDFLIVDFKYFDFYLVFDIIFKVMILRIMLLNVDWIIE